ncbi:SPOR domain-containing protein [Gammaproteobacteria bacterium]|nr:SPOR domain-containing protein [Gammaproteobacteria bacterium]
MKMVRHLQTLFAVPFLILAQQVFSAQHAFVIGSFKDSESAHTEASRISEELDAEVVVEEILIDSVIFHRLLIPRPANPNLEKELTRELVSLGVKDIWHTKIDLNEDGRFYQLGNQSKQEVWSRAEGIWNTENLVAPEKPFYKVAAGSFKQESKAEEFAQELRSWGEDFRVEDTTIFGKVFYRVVLGPLLQSDALLIKKKLEGIGVVSPWLVHYEETVPRPRGVSIDLQDLDALEFDSAPTEREEVKSSTKSVFSEFADTEYNLAKLKKK